MASVDIDAGSATKKVIKATPGNVFAIRATNINAALRWLQIHDKATAPAGNDIPRLAFPIPVTTGIMSVSQDFLAGIEACANGVSWAISTTATPFTDSATANEHTVVIKFG